MATKTIPDLRPYFRVDTKANKTIFIGTKMEAYIPMRYGPYDLLSQEEMLNTLGIFGMKINDTVEGGIFMPAVIKSRPTHTYTSTIADIQYLVAEYKKDDILIDNMSIIENARLGYVLWNEFIALGNLPDFLEYDQWCTMFDLVSDLCGIKFKVNHAVFEMIYSHLARDADDLTLKYRLSSMLRAAVFIKLRSVAYGPDSAAAKIMGSYMDLGLTSAMVNASNGDASPLETILCR